ncbi:MarR family winged helix-turn-helix transcriptional regulator [Veillonella caviae]|uniref:MarR family winged helix-turn-helix transcriptional regulator n=1 Tax=Veillonella caviae TaxID=248316 RepID=UPI000F8CE4D3|nr:helix-turn-helix domain-containing protein [Veillonella caviae]
MKSIEKKNNSQYFEDCPYFTAAKYLRKMEQVTEAYLKETGLAPAYAYILEALDRYDDVNSIMSISHALGYERSTVSRLVKKLEKEGLVELSPDGRATHVALTAAGKRLDDELIKPSIAKYSADMDTLLGGQERVQLTYLLVESTEKIERIL